MTENEKQEAVCTVQELEARTKHLLENSKSLSHEAHQLRLMLNELAKLSKFVESVEI